MRIFATLAVLAALIGGVAAFSVPASAYNCTTQCYGNTCYTHCF